MSGSPTDPAQDEWTCRLCGSVIGTAWLQSTLGERFCNKHGDLSPCRLCGAPAANPPYCVVCGATVVSDQAAVRSVLPAIRADLHLLGIRLHKPVRVELVSDTTIRTLAGAMHDLPGTRPGKIRGVTQSAGVTVIRLAVAAGMPHAQFGAVVAHEAMHAWMAQRGFPDLPAPIDEGLCQLTAFAWLRRQHDPRAELVRTAMEMDPDPDYGTGFRTVRDAVRRSGLKTVLATVRSTGRLP